MPDPADTQPDHVAVEQFVTLFTVHQRRIFQYILSLLPNVQDAEDVLQETNLILWRKFPTFQPGTSFLAWAARIAHYEVLKYRKRASYRRTSLLDEELIEQLGSEAIEASGHLDSVRESLGPCLQKLRPEDRDLVARRYGIGDSGKGLAEALGRPANSVYKSLGRIRRTLLDCINRSLQRADARGGMA